jgi:hypothetical protein
MSCAAMSSTLPDLAYIKRDIPIAAVADELNLEVSGNMMRCWRPANHQHGDRTPSVGFNGKNNTGRCFVCDDIRFSNIDLVMAVRACSTREAIGWIAARFPVPVIPKGRHLMKREQLEPCSRVGFGGRLENVVRSGLWATLTPSAKAILGVFSELADPNSDSLMISYRGLMRFAGVGSNSSVARSVKYLERICLLKVQRNDAGDGLRGCNSYLLTLDNPALEKLMTRIHQQHRAEAEAEREIREELRSRRRQQRTALPVKPLSNHCSAVESHTVTRCSVKLASGM